MQERNVSRLEQDVDSGGFVDRTRHDPDLEYAFFAFEILGRQDAAAMTPRNHSHASVF
ncbi:hypothetical protein D3C83_214470 [compost metagenome]